MICPSCRSEVPGTPKFCNKCGAPMAASAPATPPAEAPTKVCPKCGTVNAAIARFCKKDGYAFDGAPQAPRPKPASVAPDQAAIPGSIACPTCGTLNPPNARFCKKDGTSLAGAMVSKPADLTLKAEPPSMTALPPAPPLPPSRAPLMPSPTQSVAPRPKTESPGPAPAMAETVVYKRNKGRLLAIIAGSVVFSGVAGGLLYWKGIIGNRPESVAVAITAAAHEQGFDGATITVSQDWVANVTGSVIGQVKKNELLALIQQNPNIKSVTSELTVRPGPGELEQRVADALAASGLQAVQVSVGADLVATLKGTVDDPALETVALDTARRVSGLRDVKSAIKLSIQARQAALAQALTGAGYDKATAQIVDENSVNVTGNVYSQQEKDKLVALVSSTTGIATVNDTTQIIERPPVVDAAKLEADVNRLLQKAGLGTVAAVVDENMNATLVGTVSSAADRDRALKTARKVTAIKSLRSEIEFAGAAAPAPAPVAAVVQESMALNAVKGQWVGRVDTGLFGYTFTLKITGGAAGQDVGTSVYGSGNGICGGTLTLAEASGSDFTFTENLDRTAMMCPGGGTLKMKLAGDGKALFEWYRPKNPAKRYAKGSGVRR